MLTALPSLLQAGLLRHLDQLTLPKGFYGLQSLLLWAFLLLGRVRCAERLRYEQPGEWGALLGLDRCPSRAPCAAARTSWPLPRGCRPGSAA